jgi:hypothetical protein
MDRRQESLSRLYAHRKAAYEKTQSRVYELDGVVVKQQMKVEAHDRDAIENAKEG